MISFEWIVHQIDVVAEVLVEMEAIVVWCVDDRIVVPVEMVRFEIVVEVDLYVNV